MKFDNFFLALQILKGISGNPQCTIPDVRDALGIIHENPPTQEEKDLYKVVGYLEDMDLINKEKNDEIESKGAHYHLTITRKGSNLVENMKNMFGEKVSIDVFDLASAIGSSKGDIRVDDLKMEFYVLARNTLDELTRQILEMLPQDYSRIIRSQKSRLKSNVDESLTKLVSKVSSMMDLLAK